MLEGNGTTQLITKFIKRKQPESPTSTDKEQNAEKKVGIGNDNNDKLSVASSFTSCVTGQMTSDVANMDDLDS